MVTNGGNTITAITQKYQSALTMPNATRSGYTFKGWGTSSSSTTASYQPGGKYTSNSSATLYAVWESNAPTTYTVSYNANGGSGAPSSQTKTHGVTLTLSSTKPTRSGYSFLGWSTSSSATSASYSAGGSYTTNASCTMYAVWSCNHSSTSQSYVTGCDWEKTCNNCGVVTATGTTHGPYNYGSWSYYSTSQHRRTKNCSYGDYSTYEYSSHSTSIEYESYSSTQHKYYSYCSTCASMIGSASYEAHDFTSTTSGGKTISVCNDCGYTKETVQTYTVSYNANGGSGAPSSQTKTYGVTLTLSSVVPTRSGYEFKGWGTSSASTSPSYLAGASYSTNANITLYAIWSCPHSSATQNYVTGCDWQRVCNTCGTILSTGTTHGPYTYSAWEYYSTTQHLRYKNCNYGDYSEAQYQGHSLSTKFEQYSASQHKYYSYCSECDSMVGTSNTEAHSFTSTESNGSIIYTCSECGYSYSVKKTYTVSFNANGGISAPSSQTKIHGETLTITSAKPTREGYDFKGWATSSSATSATYAAGGSYTSNANVTLYAVWQKTIFTVSYNANGGSGTMSSLTIATDAKANLTANAFTRTGYTFDGWNTAANGSGTSYADTASVKNLTTENGATITLYAQWSQCPAGTYSANGTCVTCPKGSYCVNGVENSCPDGTYADKEGMSECTACPAGSNLYKAAAYIVRSDSGATSIDSCEAVSYFMPENVLHGADMPEDMFAPDYDPNADANKRGLFAAQCHYDTVTQQYTKNCTGMVSMCSGGYYSTQALATAFQTDTLSEMLDTYCMPAEPGYWSPGLPHTDFENITDEELSLTLVRHACSTGLTTIGYGAGADEAGDCGRVLHVDGKKLYLRSTEKTDVSLHVKVDGVTFFGNMVVGDRKISADADKTLKIKHNGQIYSVYDDSVN